MLEIILFLVLGMFLGSIAGLIPGLHTNLISALTITFLPFLLTFFSPLIIMLFIVGLTMANLFLDTIPSTYLSAPSEETTLTVLPSHELLLEGKGHTAVYFSSLGNLFGLFLTLILTPLFLFFLPKIYPFFEKMMFWLLCWICIFIIYNEKKKLLSIMIFFLAGFLGMGATNLNLPQPLLPLLTGLFGISSILSSIKQKTNIPPQTTEIKKEGRKEFLKPLIAGSLISPLCSFLPGLGGSQATIIGSSIFKDISRKQFLILNGIINSTLMGLSFVVLFILEKSRTGSAEAISQITTLTTKEIIVILIAFFISGLVVYFLTIIISKNIAKKIEKVNYFNLSITVLIFLVTLSSFITGIRGLAVLVVATLLGLACEYFEVRKGILMGCLLIPTLIIYFPV